MPSELFPRRFMNVYFKSRRKSVPARGGSIRLSSFRRCKSLDLRPPTLRTHTYLHFRVALAREFITFDPTRICAIEMRRNKPRLDTVEIDGSRSIDLHTGASIFSESPACVTMAYLAITRYSSIRVCDNARPKSVRESWIFATSPGGKISCGANITSTHVMSFGINQIAADCRIRQEMRSHLCMCAGGYPARRGCY